MTLKDWILLLVPILSNGIIVFTLQKIYEKKQLIKDSKRAYVIKFKEQVDTALALQAQIVDMITNAESEDGNSIYQVMQQFIDIIKKMVYFQYQNHALLKPLKEKTQQLANLTNEMTDFIKSKCFDIEEFNRVFSDIKNTLNELQLYCVKF